jgi:O-antigen ligase
MIWLLGGYMWLFIHRPFEVWPWLGDLQIERVYMILMIVYWAVQPNKGWLPNRIHAALAFFLLVLTAGWLASPYSALPASQEVVENYWKIIVFYSLVVTSVRDASGLRTLVVIFLVAVALYAGHSLVEYGNGRYQWRMGISRMMGVDATFGDPNAFAAGLVYALPLTLPFWAERPAAWVKALLVAFTGLVVMCVLLTGSRAGFVGLGLAGLLALFAAGRRKTAVGLLGAAAILAPVALLCLPEELQNRYLTIIDPSVGPHNAQTSADGRWDGLMAGLQIWSENPMLGLGPGSFRAATGREIASHNVYGQVLSDLGTLGALALVGLVACYALNWWEARRFFRDHPEVARDFPFHVSRAVGVNVVLLLALGACGHNLYRFHWVWFAAFQAIALHCIRRRAAALVDEPAWIAEDAEFASAQMAEA